MEKKLIWLHRLLFVVLILSCLNIISNISSFNVNDLLESAIYKKAIRLEHNSILTSKNVLLYSAYAVKACIILAQVYLVYGFYLLLRTFNEFKEGNYFNEVVSNTFEKVGKVFINYCIAVFSLQVIYLFITFNNAPIMELIRVNNIDFIALCGIAFSVFSHVFRKGEELQQENKLTI